MDNNYQPQPIFQQPKPGPGMGIAGLVLGVTALLIFAFANNGSSLLVLSILGAVMSVLGIIFSSVGIKRRLKGFAISGLIVSIIALITNICFGLIGALAATTPTPYYY